MSFSMIGEMARLNLTGVTGDITIDVPRRWAIGRIYIQETANHAVTGGIKIGTTAGGVDIVAAQSVGALANIHVFDAALLKRWFNLDNPTTIFIAAVAAWNGASINMQIMLEKVGPT